MTGVFKFTSAASHFICPPSDTLGDHDAGTNSLLLVLCFLPAGGWTPAATVQTQCALLHLSRKANKSETAPPSVAAGSSQREPKRAHVTEHAAVQVSKPNTNQRIKFTNNWEMRVKIDEKTDTILISL